MHIQGQLLTPDGLKEGTLRFTDHIESVEVLDAADARPSGRIVLPGFIDTHVHGGGGGDTMDGADGVRTLARFHLRHGTTSLLPTTITAPWEQVIRALRGVAEAQGSDPLGAEILGAHLEGPFISGERLGAQPPHHVLPTRELVSEVLALNVVRVVTLAPELAGAAEAAGQFARSGVRVSLGHTAASYEEAREVLRRVQAAGGVAGGTHLFNAMGGLSGREPGVVGALLATPGVFAELILDLHHVHPGSLLAAHAALGDRLLLVTDAIRAAGRPDGPAELGGQTVRVTAGQARLADGTLAGSVLTLDAALRNAVRCGLPLERTAQLLSEAPARYLGLRDRGQLIPGLRADLVVLDEALRVQEVWLKGEQLVCHSPTR